jgi:hypothetical protein
VRECTATGGEEQGKDKDESDVPQWWPPVDHQ